MDHRRGNAPPGEALREALSTWVGARIDAAHASPATGLVALAVYAGARRVLGAGIGPHVAGAGILPRLPRLRAGASHPLVAAMRAHLVGRRVLSIEVRDDAVVVAAGDLPPGEGEVGDSPDTQPDAPPERGRRGDADGAAGARIELAPGRRDEADGVAGARIELAPGRRGEVRVFGAPGELILRWPPQGGAPPGAAAYPDDPAAAGAALVEASDAAAAAHAKGALARAVKARRAALERRADAVRGDLDRLGSVALLQKTGRLLLAQGARVPRGARKALLDDWETGGKLEVALDPSRPAKAQAEAFFTRARRYQRGEAVMRARLAETERALEAVEALAADVAAAPPHPEALEPLEKRARSLGVAAPEGAGEARKAPAGGSRADRAAPRRPFHVYRSAGGAAILVGRGGEDNDALTTKHARPHDLWLHAKGATGAHVVVPLQKGASCPAGVLVDAATLAAHFSDARGEAVCEVSYVPRRYVRKPRGAAPGAVTFDREKVIAVRMEPERLTRLLASKEEG